MTASLGSAALALAFLAAVFAAVTALIGRHGDRRWIDASRRFVYVFSRCSPLRRNHRDRLRDQRFLLQHRPAALLDRDADLLQDGGDVVEPGRLAAALGLGALDRLQRRAVCDPQQAPRGGPLRDRGAGRGRRLLHRLDVLCPRRQSLRDSQASPRRRGRPKPAASAPEHDDPPTDALFGLRRPRRSPSPSRSAL